MNSPCENCTQVDKPAVCKKCQTWDEWFVKTWDRTRIAVLLAALGIKEEQC